MNRREMYENLDKILAYGKDIKQPTTGDMFDSREDRLALETKHFPEMTLAEKLWCERKSTGWYFSGHPMDTIKGKYEHRAHAKIADIPRLLDGPTTPSNIAFLVDRVIVVKNKIAILVVEDETGIGEINAFTSDCDPWWHLMKKDNILIAQCIPRHNGKFSSMHFIKLHKLGEFTKPDWL